MAIVLLGAIAPWQITTVSIILLGGLITLCIVIFRSKNK